MPIHYAMLVADFAPSAWAGTIRLLARYPIVGITAPSIFFRNKHSVSRSIIHKVEIIINQTLT